MGRKKKIKPLTKFPKRMQKKLIVMFICITLFLGILIGRLMYIEYTSGEKYEKIVLSQQEYDSQTIPYQRGDIVDTKGTVLATSVAVYNVILDCSVMTSKDAYIEPTIDALVQCFPDYVTKETLESYAKDSKDSRYIVLAKKLPYEQVQAFTDLQEQEDEKGKLVNPNIKGVWFEKEYQREYPYNTLASSLIGFTTSGNVGINGIENYYNDTLNGVNGRTYGYLNSDNNFEKTVKEAEDGNTVVSTIDANIQSIVESKILEFNEAYTNNYREGEAGAKHIAVLAMNPNNGEVLAMASYPNYDLNNPRDLSSYYTQEEIDAMDDATKLDILNDLWQNFCVTSTYEPGSTAKPFTVATGLDTATLQPTDEFDCDGYEIIAGYPKPLRCVNRNGHGHETIEQALMNSCNDALMQMSYRIGIDNFTKYQQIFGFGQKTNIDLPGEARTDSLIYTKDTMTPIDLATNSFGQCFNVTMIQMGTAFSSLINGGYLYQPRVVKKITDSDGNTIEEKGATLLRETVSSSTSDTVKGYLYNVVAQGTASTAKVDGYSMGGKTGTAQKHPIEEKKYLVSFIGYAPQENPQIVIYCIVDEPNAADQAHSTYAQNIVREIMKEVYPYMNIYPDEELTGINDGYTITGAPNSATSPTNQSAAADQAANTGVQDSVVGEDNAESIEEGTGENVPEEPQGEDTNTPEGQ